MKNKIKVFAFMIIKFSTCGKIPPIAEIIIIDTSRPVSPVELPFKSAGLSVV